MKAAGLAALARLMVLLAAGGLPALPAPAAALSTIVEGEPGCQQIGPATSRRPPQGRLSDADGGSTGASAAQQRSGLDLLPVPSVIATAGLAARWPLILPEPSGPGVRHPGPAAPARAPPPTAL